LRSRLIQQGENAMKPRRYTSRLFDNRILEERKRLQHLAAVPKPSHKLEILQKNISQSNTATRIEEWLSSPNLKGPTMDRDECLGNAAICREKARTHLADGGYWTERAIIWLSAPVKLATKRSLMRCATAV
jgi:hypothetical protein